MPIAATAAPPACATHSAITSCAAATNASGSWSTRPGPLQRSGVSRAAVARHVPSAR
jgi:hypothetical protein